MSNLHIVTVATDSEYYFPYLIETCKNNGKNIVVLGYGKKWQGFKWKFKLMIDYIEKLNDIDIVCFVDGYDVICIRNLEQLKDEFIKLKKKYNCKLITGHDKVINYFVQKYITYTYGTCNNLNLNSGTYIGYVKDLKYILNNILNLNKFKNINDDQILYTKYCNDNNNDIYIDSNGELFLTIVYPNNDIDNYLDFNNNIISYNNNKPFFIHGPGGTYLDNILIKLNYKCNIKNNIKKTYYKKNLLHTDKYLYLFFIFILIIIFIYFMFFCIKNKKYIIKKFKYKK